MPFVSREEKAAQQAARDAEKAVRDAARQAERGQREFEESPAGQARVAFERGDGFFEIELAMRETGSLNSHGGTGSDHGGWGPHRPRSGRMDALSQVEGEGWAFVQASYVFVQTGEDSRDKFMASGQRTSIRGKMVGIYLFRRTETRQEPAASR
jgi:hypothetical protein